jgi:hypothetical protein
MRWNIRAMVSLVTTLPVGLEGVHVATMRSLPPPSQHVLPHFSGRCQIVFDKGNLFGCCTPKFRCVLIRGMVWGLDQDMVPRLKQCLERAYDGALCSRCDDCIVSTKTLSALPLPHRICNVRGKLSKTSRICVLKETTLLIA